MVKIFYSVTSTTVVDTPLTFENPETTLSIQLLDEIDKTTKGLTWYRSPASQCFAISDTLFSFELLWNKFTWLFQSEWLKWAEELFLSELVWPWKRHSFDLLIFRTVLELALHEELPVQCIFPVFLHNSVDIFWQTLPYLFVMKLRNTWYNMYLVLYSYSF